MREHSVKGFKFHPNIQAFYPNDPAVYPVYEAIAEHGAIASWLARRRFGVQAKS